MTKVWMIIRAVQPTCIATCLMVGMLLSVPLTAGADVLLIDSVQHATQRGDLPRTGLLMDDVRSRWGEPLNEFSPVGQPPITRWDFADFSVYFEYDHVISSVLHEGEVLETGGDSSY